MTEATVPPAGLVDARIPATDAPRPEMQIIPLRGRPFVGIALAVVLFAITSNSMWALMLAHVAGGGIWTAVDLFLGLILGPIMGKMSIPARAELTSRLMPKMVLLMPTLVMMTLASGFQIAVNYGNFFPGTANRPWLIASMVVVGIMSVVALGLLEPANIAVLYEMRKRRPDGEVIDHLMKRFLMTAGITGVMQVATLLIMTRVATN